MKFLQSISKITIARHLSILVMGTLFAQGVMFIFQMILRRLYTPEEFGAFAVYMSLLGILATWSSFRFEQTIVLPKNENSANHLLGLSLLGTFIFSVLIFLTILLFNQQIIQWTGFPQKYKNWLIVLPVSIFLFGFYQALNYYLIRQKWFSVSAQNKVSRRFTEGIIQTVFGFFQLPFGLIIGDWFGQLVNIFHSGFRIFKNKKWSQFNSVQGLKDVAITYRKFPLQNGLPSMLNALSLMLPVLFINRLYDAQTTGYFDLARTVLILPLSLITSSLSQVMLQRFSEKRNLHQSIKKEALGIFSFLLFFSLLFGFTFHFYGELLFGYVFGNEWRISGIYSKILIWAFAFKFIISPFNILFTAFEKIGTLSVWQLFYFTGIISLLWIPNQEIQGFLKTYLLIELTSYGIACVLIFRLIFGYEKQLKPKKIPTESV